jgi:hypothetical protein
MAFLRVLRQPARRIGKAREIGILMLLPGESDHHYEPGTTDGQRKLV